MCGIGLFTAWVVGAVYFIPTVYFSWKLKIVALLWVNIAIGLTLVGREKQHE